MLRPSISLIVRLLIVRFLLRRFVTILLWAGLIAGLIIIATVMAAKAQALAPMEAREVVLVEPLSPAISPCPLSNAPRGIYSSQIQQITVPRDLPEGTILVVSGGPMGTEEIVTDDASNLTVTRQDGTTRELRLTFMTGDRKEVLPMKPVEVTDMVGRGEVTIRVGLLDLKPPTCSSSPYYLVGLAPKHPRQSEGAGASASNGDKPANQGESGKLPPPKDQGVDWKMVAGAVGGSLLVLVMLGRDVRKILTRVVDDAARRSAGVR